MPTIVVVVACKPQLGEQSQPADDMLAGLLVGFGAPCISRPRWVLRKRHDYMRIPAHLTWLQVRLVDVIGGA